MDKNQPKVMVIEDESLLLKAIITKLKLKQMVPIPFESANEAIDYLRTDQPRPDIIWLDYYLREMNGLDFVNELQKNPQLCKIPIIVVSNSANPQKVEAMVALGIKKYLLKADHRLDDLVNIIEDILNNKGEAIHE